ncbi:UV DNA damage repair endonuclease UvsE [Acetobacterium tundrae]|uniref:UV DNA damage repair endonuclease UvsE n=1 Tax=Acetobacterium tundrae TaxID=132932 RepID=A0ABR6WIW8_9FIRM|nr:UV DNA damage repair endonuclease UvsE [Acetobacterium tundrae]MBC3796294.1 UV DNA damage repair endonuclease UvsE [Acetobacterium tundrae]
MKIGYACLTVGVPNTDLKTCLLKNASDEKLIELIEHNLNVLENMIDYNLKNDINLFRISSSLIPFGSSPVNHFNWWELFDKKLAHIGKKIRQSGMRVSLHPGQYTVLNAIDDDIVKRAIEDLNYHTRLLDSLGVGTEHKIVLHIGGVYNNKNKGKLRFIKNYQGLDKRIKNRLVIENDGKCYTICDVLEIGNYLDIPVIFDVLHHKDNPCKEEKTDAFWIKESKKTWEKKDGNQKIHYSQQNPEKKQGSHSKNIRIDEFMAFYDRLDDKNLDIMLEVKDKNLSAIKCLNCISEDRKIKVLEREWSRYKYAVLERSPLDYLEIRKLLHNKNNYPAIEFYHLIENALQKETTIGNSINVAQHIWGYFRNNALPSEKKYFLKLLDRYEKGEVSIKKVKKNLWKMAVKYEQVYLLESYYYEMV